MSSGVLDWVGSAIGTGRYTIVAKVGEGGMGYVYCARDANLETDVIVKVPRRAILDDEEFAERFAREVRSLVRLSHPHVVKVIDVGVHDGIPFAVMQYLSGGSLESRHASGHDSRLLPVDPHSLREWLPSIAKALDFIHRQGYIHRDVKPANILFDAHGNAYLSDFGIAKVLAAEGHSNRAASLTGTGMVLGTPHYMAPELVLGEQVDGRVDQYALAVAVHELLTGTLPIDAPTAAAVLVQQATRPPKALRDLAQAFDGSLTEAVLKALAKAPDGRFATCGEFADTVLAAVAPMPSGSPIVPVLEKPRIPITSRATSPGRVPCPDCGAVLVLKPQHAGRRARCHKCDALLIISQDISELTLANPVADSTPAKSRLQTVGASTANEIRNPRKQPVLPWLNWSPSTLLARLTERGFPRREAALIGGGALALVCVVALAAYWLVGSPRPSDRPIGWKSQPIGPTGIPEWRISAGSKVVIPIPLDSAHQKGELEFRLGQDTPAGATIDATSGRFEWTPTLDQQGQYTIFVDTTSRRDGQPVEGFVFTLTVESKERGITSARRSVQPRRSAPSSAPTNISADPATIRHGASFPASDVVRDPTFGRGAPTAPDTQGVHATTKTQTATAIDELARTFSAPSGLVLEDHFDGHDLNTTSWEVIEGTGTVRVSQGHVEICNRGYLATKARDLKPTSSVPLEIQGYWTIHSASSLSHDNLSVATRTNAKPLGKYHEPECGVVCLLSGNGFIRISSGEDILQDAKLPVVAQDKFHFRITDDGRNISFVVTKVGDNQSSASLAATNSFQSGTNRVLFYNREGTSHTAFLDDVRIMRGIPDGASPQAEDLQRK